MTAIDWIVFAILAGSVVMGLMRGFVREAFSLAAWVVAFIAARTLSPVVAMMIPGIEQEGLRQAAAIVVVFIAVLVLVHLASALVTGLMKWIGLGGFDRLMGMLFGVLRAAVVLTLLALLAGLSALPRTEAWRASISHGYLEAMAKKTLPWLPDDLAALIRFA